MATSLFGPMPIEQVRPSRSTISAFTARRVDGRALEVAERGEVEEGLVDARLLEGIGAPGGDGHDPVRHLAIDGTVVAEEHGFRLSAAPRRLRQAPGARDRHRRPDAVPSGPHSWPW